MKIPETPEAAFVAGALSVYLFAKTRSPCRPGLALSQEAHSAELPRSQASDHQQHAQAGQRPLAQAPDSQRSGQ